MSRDTSRVRKVIVIIWTSFTSMLPDMIDPGTHKRDAKDYGNYEDRDVRGYEYSTTAIFDGLGVAFPECNDLKVVCVGNISLSKELKSTIIKKTENLNGTFIQIPSEHEGYQVLRNIISSLADCEEPTAIIDSDMVFWHRFDEIDDDSLYEGYFVPSYERSYSKDENMFIHQNIHAAFLKIKNPKLLAETISDLELKYPWLDVYKPMTFKNGDRWEHHDTMSILYSLVSEDTRKFTAREMEKFVHLYGGNQFDYWTYMRTEDNMRSLELRELYGKIHSHVTNNEFDELKNLWKWYKEYKFGLLSKILK